VKKSWWVQRQAADILIGKRFYIEGPIVSIHRNNTLFLERPIMVRLAN